MSSDLKSRKIILINSSLILVFVLFQAAINIYISSRITEETNQIEKAYNQKIEHISMMRHIAHERTLIALSIYLTNDFWQRDEYYIQFAELAEAFIKERNMLESLVLEKVESEKLNELYAVIRHTQPLQVNIVKRIMAGDSKEVFSDLVLKDLPLEKDLSNAFQSLIQTVNSTYSLRRNQLNNKQATASFMGMLVSLIIIVSISLVIRRVVQKLENVEHELVQEKDRLSWDAVHDPLTEVYNRRWLVNHFNNIDRNTEATHSLLYIDLDDFKKINDQYSHEAGDLYLKEVVKQMQKCIRFSDFISRMGGDEFCICLENCSLEKSKNIAECILKTVSELTIQCQDSEISSNGCSIGLTEFNSRDAEFDNIVRQADQAAIEAKRSGKNRIECYQK